LDGRIFFLLLGTGGAGRIASTGLTTLKTKAAIGEAGGDDMIGLVEQGTAASETNTPP